MALRFRPHESLSHITKVLRQYLHLPDPQVLYVVLGTVAGNHLPGTPVWTMLIGGPSAGGSTLVTSLLGYTGVDDEILVEPVRNTHPIDSVKGAAAFLSASPKRDKARDATGGVLREIGNGGQGILVMSDFTNILNLRNEQQAEVIACLRMIYDGKFVRAVGTDGAKILKWHGKVGCITKCTGIIESHHGVIGEMGQRFIMWRYATTLGHSENLKALAVKSKREMDIDIANAVGTHLNQTLDIIDKGNVPFELEVYENQWTNFASQLICRARSVVKRDKYKSDVIEFIPAPEGPMRVAGEFKSLFLGMRVAGVEDQDAHRVLSSMLWGSLPAIRGNVMQCIIAAMRAKGAPYHKNRFTNEDIDAGVLARAKVDGYRMTSPPTIRRNMEDIEHLGIIERVNGIRSKRVEWVLADDIAGLCRELRIL